MFRRFLIGSLVVFGMTGMGWAGHETPCFIDGCQSIDGRFVITAELAKDPGPKGRIHGPMTWNFVWKDTKENKTITFPAQGVQKGQIHAQLYIAPDGETFALFNHITQACEQSHMHGPPDMRAAWEGKTGFSDRAEFARRIIIYKKDGSIIKSIGAKDLLTKEEWDSVVPFFNRFHWLQTYDGMNYKMTPRIGYATHRISPDYTVLEMTLVAARNGASRKNRVLRIDLTNGNVLEEKDWPTDRNKVPVQPFVGPKDVKEYTTEQRDGYVPSLDPVRTAGKFPAVIGTPKP